MRVGILIGGGGLTSLLVALIVYFAMPEAGKETSITPTQTNLSVAESSQSLANYTAQNITTSESWLYVIVVILGLALVFSIGITFYLYKWRKILLSEPHYLMPEEQGKHLDQLTQYIIQLSQDVNQSSTNAAQNSDLTLAGVSNLLETFMTMQSALDQREKEIQRLKRGYDAEIFRKFIGRFIRIDETIDDFKAMGEIDLQKLDQLQHLLHDAFAECSVECFKPTLETDYRSAFGVADNPKKTRTNDPDMNFKISEIIENGYCIRNGEQTEVVKAAKVKIYTFQEEGEGK